MTPQHGRRLGKCSDSAGGSAVGQLRHMTLGNDRVVESLIEYEQSRRPQLSREELAQYAIERWQYENRTWR